MGEPEGNKKDAEKDAIEDKMVKLANLSTHLGVLRSKSGGATAQYSVTGTAKGDKSTGADRLASLEEGTPR
jgi:hypothetical protein